MRSKFNPDGPFPQMAKGADFWVYIHCGKMDIAQMIIKTDGRFYLGNNGVVEYGIYGAPRGEIQIQKEITNCPGCGKPLK